jgi:hypothetical protein
MIERLNGSRLVDDRLCAFGVFEIRCELCGISTALKVYFAVHADGESSGDLLNQDQATLALIMGSFVLYENRCEIPLRCRSI